MQNRNSLFDSLQSLGNTLGDIFQPAQLLTAVQPPPWLVDEVQQRIVLLLNHVLQQEPEAMQRLQRQQGKVVALHWHPFSLRVTATPAGLLNVAEDTTATVPENVADTDTAENTGTGNSAPDSSTPDAATPKAADSATAADSTGTTQRTDLTITITEQSPLTLLRAAASSGKPATRIEGDVQLAAEINWLTAHVRWDAEEDLSRFVGDAAAHRIASTGSQALAQLKAWTEKAMSLAPDANRTPDTGADSRSGR